MVRGLKIISGAAALALALTTAGCDDASKEECKNLLAAINAMQPQHVTAPETLSAPSFASAVIGLFGQYRIKPPDEFPDSALKQCQAALRQIHGAFPSMPMRDVTLDMLTGYMHWLDPHSEAISEREIARLSGYLSGFGFNVERLDTTGPVRIIDVIAGSPADVAGLRDGMLIWTLDKTYVRGMTTSALQALVTDRHSDALTVGVVGATSNSGPQSYHEIVVHHGEFEASPVKLASYVVRSNESDYRLAYIKLRGFAGAQAFFAEGLNSFSGAEALVLDLRNIPGGEIEGAAGIASLLYQPCKGPASPMPFAGLRGRDGQIREVVWLKTVSGTWGSRPIVVLVDSTTKSAAELLAGALQDYGATVVGTPTFGKGTRQTLMPLTPYGLSGALLLTDAYTVRPSGKLIQLDGVEPDIRLPQPRAARFESDYPHSLPSPAPAGVIPGFDPATQLPERSPTLVEGLKDLETTILATWTAPYTPGDTSTFNDDPMLDAAARAAVYLVQHPTTQTLRR